LRNLDEETSQKLLELGLTALNDISLWIDLEYSATQICEKPHLSIKRTFSLLMKIFNDDKGLNGPSRLNLKGNITNIDKLYIGSSLLARQYRSFLKSLQNSNQTSKAVLDVKESTYATLVKLLQKDELNKVLSEKGILAFSTSKALLEEANTIPNFTALHFNMMLSFFSPATFTRKIINIRGIATRDFTELYDISPIIFNDIERYASLVPFEVPKRKPNTIIDRFSFIKRALPEIRAQLSHELHDLFLKEGFIALIQDKFFLKRLYTNNKISTGIFKLVYEISQTIYPDQTPRRNELRDNLLFFPGVEKDREIPCDFTKIREISEKLYEDICYLLENCQQNIEHKTYSNRTLYSRFQQIKSYLIKYHSTFTREQASALKKMGISAFEINDGELQKHILSQLQSDVHTQSFHRITAKSYRDGLIWMLKELNIQVYDIYPIKLTKTVKHRQRLNTDDFYTETQCREIAFYIEILLEDKQTHLRDKVILNFAKIILKTGWNVSPLVNLECDDIAEIESPLTGKNEYVVLLQKNRAGYRNDTYKFSADELTSKSLKSAIVDILNVRDNLTKNIRSDCKYKTFLFLIPKKGEISPMEYQDVKRISYIIKRAGCKTPFIAQKVRKGGVNHLYRSVQKNMRQYESVANHSFETFDSYYLRIRPDESRYTLSKASEVMSDYFSGKEISPEIKIITDKNNRNEQITPIGSCVSVGNDDESARYAKEHRKIRNASTKENIELCADFLSCIWCKYFRVVVDAEHVWKLLSYKKYILNNMKQSVIDFDDSSAQQSSIVILEERVNSIIESLRARNKDAVKDGFLLLEENGMHPDWDFVNPTYNQNTRGE
jgi:hypothetical protein